MQRNYIKITIRSIGLLLAFFFIYLSFRYFYAERLWQEARKFFVEKPLLILLIFVVYLVSFMLRAEAWRRYLGKSVKYISCLEGVLLSLFVNHITPLKVGDAVRIGILVLKEKHIKPDISAHSVIVLRALDMSVLMLYSITGLIVFSKSFLFRNSFILLFIGLLIGTLGLVLFVKYCPKWIKKHITLLKNNLTGKNFIAIFTLTALSWVLEAAVVWGVALSIESRLTVFDAIWVNSITIGGQVFQITPGGLSTYESVMTAALTSIHYPAKDGYIVAILTHSFKFIFSYTIGLLLMIQNPISKYKQIKELALFRRDEK